MSIDRHSPKPHTAAKTLAETVAGAACGLMWDKDIHFSRFHSSVLNGNPSEIFRYCTACWTQFSWIGYLAALSGVQGSFLCYHPMRRPDEFHAIVLDLSHQIIKPRAPHTSQLHSFLRCAFSFAHTLSGQTLPLSHARRRS